MTTRQMFKIAKKAEDEEFLKFENIPNTERLSQRPGLHAFLLLDKMTPANRDIVVSAEHDEIWLDIDLDDLAEIITEADIVTLLRCGVRFDEDTDSLALFV